MGRVIVYAPGKVPKHGGRPRKWPFPRLRVGGGAFVGGKRPQDLSSSRAYWSRQLGGAYFRMEYDPRKGGTYIERLR
jgi:hypothetical protein